MRIAVTNNFFPPRVGGSSHLADSLAREYAAAGHEVLVITTEYADAPKDETRDGFRIVRLPARHLPQLGTAVDFDITFTFGIRNLRRLFTVLDEFRPDVIHQNGQFLDLTWLTAIYARRRNVPCLLGVHTRLESTTRGYDLAFRGLDAAVVRPWLALGRPTYVVMDQPMNEYIRARYRASDSKLAAIPVGVYVADIDPLVDGAAIRDELGIGDRPMILSVGHVIPLRSRVDLIEALPFALESRPDLAVVVVGSVHYPRFLERADELGVRDSVYSTGAEPRAKMAAYLAAADLEIHELEGLGMGTATLEAMAAEVPVVAAVRADNFLGIQLRSGENITLVPRQDPRALADAIDRLLSDPDAARRVARAQRELVVEHFAMDRVVARYLEELERLVAQHSSM